MNVTNDYAWAGELSAPVALAVGVVACFWGYRIVKVILGIIGFVAGAAAGWEFASALVPGHEVVAFVSALVGGATGAVLCIWLFFLGIFLLGASAGTVVAGAVFSGTGHQAQPLLYLAFALVFGLLALVLQKFMIVLSTAFGGSYLIVASIVKLIAGAHAAPLWFDPSKAGSPDLLGYGVLAFWVILGLFGLSYQYRGAPRRNEVVRHETQPAPP
jgi:hypothetical protein